MSRGGGSGPGRRPNIVLVLTDNQAAGTLGCYGNPEVHTPHLDRMAAEGVRFANAWCANAFCSPCRASLMTGKMPSQHGVHSWLDDRRRDEWPPGWNALAGQRTLPELLQAEGYATGHFGKHHLGDPAVPPPGWDHWVTMADGHVRSFYDNRIFDNGRICDQQGHSVDFFTDRALGWIAGQEAAGQGPWFAYVPLPAPYGHWPATSDGRRNRHAALYDDCPMHSVPREAICAEALAHYDRVKGASGGGLDFSMLVRAPNHLPTLRNYYSQLTMIDEAVGRILAAVPDAVVIFAADHGLSLGHHGFWGHGAATWPSNLHRAAHSIPLIARWPGQAAAGRVEARQVSNTDLFATLLELSGGHADPALPSRSLVPLLAGRAPGQDWGEDAAYAEQEETRVIRTPEWLLMRRFRRPAEDAPGDALFDLRADPGETRNLAGEPARADVLAELSARIEAFFARHSDPRADLWRGGRPIQNSALPGFWRRTWGEDWAPVMGYEDGE